MADPNTRQGKRTPVTLKIKFKSETLEQFIERYAVDVSQGGIFIRTKEPLAVGTQMKFEFQLRDASPLIGGEGTVVWTRENDPSRPAIAPGMGVRFDRLNEGSQTVLERILAEKAKQAPQRGGVNESPTKPPLFTDTPTKVAPVPVQEALGVKSGRVRSDSEQTPLPKPVPFHSDADDFDEGAFQEATKVRSLDELVAQTANPGDPKTTVMPADELAKRRAGRDSTQPDDRSPTMPDRDSAPGLPSPPEPERRGLDTSPSPRSAAASAPPATKRPSGSSIPPIATAKTMPAMPSGRFDDAVPRGVADSSRSLPVKRPSSAPMMIGVLVFVAAAAAGVWFFVLRDNLEDDNATPVVKKNPPPVGSAGSAVAVKTGSDSGGSAEVKPPPPPVNAVDTIITANTTKATVEVAETDQIGPAPLTAKLEKDRAYKVKVSAPGYVAVLLDVKGGQDKVTAKLQPKPKTLTVTSDPPGASIYIDNAATGKQTPADIELNAAQAAKAKLHVQFRKAGYRAADQLLDATSFVDGDAKLVATVEGKLSVQVVNTGGGNRNTGGGNRNTGSASPTNSGSGASNGSDTSNGSASSGTGSDTKEPPPPPPPPPPGGGEGSAKPAGGAEPEPDWSKKP